MGSAHPPVRLGTVQLRRAGLATRRDILLRVRPDSISNATINEPTSVPGLDDLASMRFAASRISLGVVFLERGWADSEIEI